MLLQTSLISSTETAARRKAEDGLTRLAILITPFGSQARGDAPGWVIMAPMGLIAAAALMVLRRLLYAIERLPPQTSTSPRDSAHPLYRTRDSLISAGLSA